MSEHQPSTPRRVRLSADDAVLVEEIFAEALSNDREARSSLVAERCGSRPDLRLEIEALLAAHDRVTSFLVPRDADVPADAGQVPSWSGAVIGQYRVVEKIGEGGMGDVYLAERADGLFTHRAAVKVMRASVRDRDGSRRFRAERQILASLQHPNIVTLLDGGETAEGHAYLVMERVDGLPITRYVREGALTLNDRLTLLSQVCRAVQYAHQRGIVHRDLKPGNILVTPDGVPKVLDFGVAKLLETSGIEGGTATGFFPGPLTPNYASPEQVRGLPVTTACDVYALGVLAYEVTAGVRPYETIGKAVDEVIEIVVETDPVRPSAAREGAPKTDPERRRLKGDLDAIILKAMSKEPERRYGSAGELADDLERFLAGKPVVAREPSAAYILRRLAARNKAAVAVGAASLTLIFAALGTALWQRQAAVRAQARAEARFKEVRQLANTLIFKIHDAVMPLAGSTPVRRTIVEEGLIYLQRLEPVSRQDPMLQLELADAYRQIGAVLGNIAGPNLGDRQGAFKQFEKSRELAVPLARRREASFEEIAALINTDLLLVPLFSEQQKRARAREMAREAFDHAERAFARYPTHPNALPLVARTAFFMALATDPVEARIPIWRRAGELYERLLAEKPDDSDRQRNVALVEKYLGSVFDALNRDDEALPHYRRALELDEKRYARDPESRSVQFDLAMDLANIAGMMTSQKKLDEGYTLFSRSLEIRRRLSDSDPNDALARSRLGFVHMQLAFIDNTRGRYEEALVNAREAVRIQQSVLATTNDARSRYELALAVHQLAHAEIGARLASACGTARRAHALFESLPAATRAETTSDEDAAALVADCATKAAASPAAGRKVAK